MSADDEGASGRRPSANSNDTGGIEAAKRTLWNAAYDSVLRWAAADRPSREDARWYRTEQRILQQHVEPIYWGAFAGVFLFVTLRVSGSHWFARMRHTMLAMPSGKNATPKGNVTGDPIPPPQHQPTAPPQWKSHLDKETERYAAYTKDLFQLPGDAFLAILCSISATLWLSRPTQFCKDIVEAPLLPGKSLVYEHVCPDMEATFQRVVATTHDGDMAAANDSTLQHFGALVYNCRQRSRYLGQRQRQHSSGMEQIPGVVPYPGLEGKRIP